MTDLIHLATYRSDVSVAIDYGPIAKLAQCTDKMSNLMNMS